MVDPITILGALWAGYVVMRLESLAKHHRELQKRVAYQHGIDPDHD